MQTLNAILRSAMLPARSAVLLLALAGAAVAEPCTGDCNNDGTVAVSELILGVNIALGTSPVARCLRFDINQDHAVAIDELIAAVARALGGCPAGCGNGRVEFDRGETCDDGNTEDGDDCPADCVIQACTPSGSTVTADVHFTAPPGVVLGALTTYVSYPDGVVSIPGSAGAPQVRERVVSDAFSTTPNDLNYALRVVQLDPIAELPSPAFTVEFDACAGAPAPAEEDFTCTVELAGDLDRNEVEGVTCAVILP